MHPAETSSLTYRPFFRLLLLPTPPLGDAVTFGFGVCDFPPRGLPPPDLATLGPYGLQASGLRGLSTHDDVVIFHRST